MQGHVKNKKISVSSAYPEVSMENKHMRWTKNMTRLWLFLSFWGENVTYFGLKPWLHSIPTDR